MMALTIWQPWASLIMAGVKPWEFRGHPAPRSQAGKRIVIHAGARKVQRGELQDLIVRLGRADQAWTTGLDLAALPLLERWLASPGMLPLASGLGHALLGEPVRADQLSEIAGHAVNDSDRMDHSKWAWPLTDIAFFSHPIPQRGAQGFWPWPPLSETAA